MIAEKNKFIWSTLKFCIAGIFIPGFTALTILGVQSGIELLGIECSRTWTILWALTTVGLVAAPFLFIRMMNKTIMTGRDVPTSRLTIFNIVEYTFIQATLASFFTNGRTLCYVTDGQNGLEFAFTGWMALPFLVVISLVFDSLRKEKISQFKDMNLSAGEGLH